MTTGALLLGLALAAPLALLALCLVPGLRPSVPRLLPLAPLPALAAAVLALAGPAVSLDLPALRLSLRLDAAGAVLLAPAALLWSVAGLWASGWLSGTRRGLRFVVCWLLTLSGSIGVFAVADLPGFYFFFALVSLPAYGLVAHDETPAADRAGAVYIAFAVLGEALLLIGLALLAAGTPDGSLQIRDALAAVPRSPWGAAAVGFTAAGLLFKMATVPVHGWMPLAYTAAPIPAAAVLSGAAVKAGVIGLLRFLPLGDVGLAGGLAPALVGLGLLSAFYGVALGLTQTNPRTVLAYSSISQMGVIAALLGMGWAAGDATVGLDAALYGANHALAKGGLFLAVGLVIARDSPPARATLVAAAVLALGLGGLPLTGGAIVKQVAKSTLGDGLVGALALASSVGTSLLMSHFLAMLVRAAGGGATRADGGARWNWSWRLAVAAAIAVPWALFLALGGAAASVLAPGGLLAAAWPVAAGVALWFVLRRALDRLPRMPAGDLLAVQQAAFDAVRQAGPAAVALDLRLRGWAVAGLSLLTVAIVLAAATVLRP